MAEKMESVFRLPFEELFKRLGDHTIREDRIPLQIT